MGQGDEMIQKVYDILKNTQIPTMFVLRPDISGKNRSGVSYHFFSESYNLYGDSEGREFGGVLQIDVFSLDNYNDLVDQIKSLMKSNGFRLADCRDSDDSFNNVQYYHKVMIFNYVEREVR